MNLFGCVISYRKTIQMIDTNIENYLFEYRETILERINEFQPFLDECLDNNLFELLSKIKKIIENLEEHLELTNSALCCNVRGKRYFVKLLIEKERMDLPINDGDQK